MGLLLALFAVSLQARETAFVRVNLVPMDRERVLRDQTIIVRDGYIAQIGNDIKVPADAQVIDGEGRLWVSPGLADMHVHSDTRDDLAVYLANGVTTIVNMGDARMAFVGRLSSAAARGDIAGPRVFSAFVIDGSPAFGHFTVTTPKEARTAVMLAKTNGYRFIKVYNNLEADVFAAAADEAASQGLALVGHGITKLGLEAQIEQGQAAVAHAEEFFYTFFSAPGSEQTDAPPPVARIADVIALLRRHGTAVGADLVTYGGIMRVIGHREVVAACLAAANASLVSPADRLAWRRSGYVAKTADLRARYAFLQQMLKAMADADVPLLAGTDAPTIPCVAAGFSLHENLAELEQAGLSRFQALSTATRIPGAFLATTIGATRNGVIESGARADLIVSAASPLDDLGTLRDPVGVMVEGRWHDRTALAAMLDNVRQAYSLAE
ncbi:amidohydrolase family protein [Sphingobium lignivorans]|uniref:Imidazolonepropionase-like amidohydrolase n=1 Tax=Sphingobium lignivorans TaxID=2735886 RepID=A0ABR6NGW0_9SPHN|nr:amidohydrolase family protein [Sphingobium lignivorans]MBB5986506.1 imidazolonepropionase-like amidohydrolase [Sphingobium lignivorans]